MEAPLPNAVARQQVLGRLLIKVGITILAGVVLWAILGYSAGFAFLLAGWYFFAR